MTVIFGTLMLAALLGFLLGGRLSNLARLRIRWVPAAVVGLALQLAPVPGRTWPLLLLYVSFALLTAFAIVNIQARVPGAWLILIGVWLNFAVIAVNQGMPVARYALERSDQMETLRLLVEEGGAKHHLAGPEDQLLFLGDVIAIGPPVRQAISLGDIFTYAGVAWLVVAGMRGPRRRTAADADDAVDAGDPSPTEREEVRAGVG
jgi:hypothetical protein